MTYRAIVDPTRWVQTSSLEADVRYPALRVLSDVVAPTAFTPAFTPSAGTITVGSSTGWYARVGGLLVLSVTAFTVSLTNACTLALALPGGFTVAKRSGGFVVFSDNGAVGCGLVDGGAAATSLSVIKDVLGSNWAVSVANSYFSLSITIAIS